MNIQAHPHTNFFTKGLSSEYTVEENHKAKIHIATFSISTAVTAVALVVIITLAALLVSGTAIPAVAFVLSATIGTAGLTSTAISLIEKSIFNDTLLPPLELTKDFYGKEDSWNEIFENVKSGTKYSRIDEVIKINKNSEKTSKVSKEFCKRYCKGNLPQVAKDLLYKTIREFKSASLLEKIDASTLDEEDKKSLDFRLKRANIEQSIALKCLYGYQNTFLNSPILTSDTDFSSLEDRLESLENELTEEEVIHEESPQTENSQTTNIKMYGENDKWSDLLEGLTSTDRIIQRVQKIKIENYASTEALKFSNSFCDEHHNCEYPQIAFHNIYATIPITRAYRGFLSLMKISTTDLSYPTKLIVLFEIQEEAHTLSMITDSALSGLDEPGKEKIKEFISHLKSIHDEIKENIFLDLPFQEVNEVDYSSENQETE